MALVGLATSVGFIGGTVPGGVAASASGTAASVTAVLLDSYWGCRVMDAWETLNTDWQTYGTVPVSISTGGRLCAGHFTLADLEASGADTVIVSDSAFFYRWTPGEFQALQQYLEEGHTLVGTGVDFQWHRHYDNPLALVFGLKQQTPWRVGGPGGADQPTYRLKTTNPAAPVLFRNVPNPYVSSTVGARVQMTADEVWDASDLAGASYLGLSKRKREAITLYAGSGYDAIYIDSAAWLQSTPADLQFLYNAIIYPQSG